MSDEPLPVRPAAKREALFTALRLMAINQSMEINRKLATTYFYLHLFRKSCPEKRFIARQVKPGWSRIWRIN